jgi:hypothetical protein
MDITIAKFRKIANQTYAYLATQLESFQSLAIFWIKKVRTRLA